MKERDPGVKWFNTIFYPKTYTGRAVRYEDGVLPRLRQAEVTLFTPWGPRYSWETRGVEIKDGDKELAVLRFFASMLEEWKRNMPGKKFRWLFLGADLYGTRINHLPEWVVREYFTNLKKKISALLPGVEFHCWSEFDRQAEWYREWALQDLLIVGRPVIARAHQTARAMKRGGDAQQYLAERLAEARHVEGVIHPIKLSCVARHKDHGVDLALPRLYLLPRELHAPWL
ncbi:MAG: hypothetical protein M0P64_04810 [Candidatus Pacebacteria bacterium]|jgi:hypothetical protein|nr:hypothetical protein [Candidatus Paceibacterota bacterium]